MAKKTPEENEALKKTAAERKAANQLAAQEKLESDKAKNLTAVKQASDVPALFIKSKAHSFHRCGFKFTNAGFGIALDALTPEQIETLKSETELIVEECEIQLD